MVITALSGESELVQCKVQEKMQRHDENLVIEYK